MDYNIYTGDKQGDEQMNHKPDVNRLTDFRV